MGRQDHGDQPRRWCRHDGDRRIALARRSGAVGHMIRVVLADDQALVRSGLRALLATSNDIQVVGEAGTDARPSRL